MREVRFEGADGELLRGVFRPADPEAEGGAGRACVVVHGLDGPGPGEARLGARLAAAGIASLVPDLWSREGRPGGFEALPDRRALADLEGALAWLGEREDLDGRSLAVAGRGHGGTLAFLAGCTSRRVAAAASLGGGVVYGRLSAAHPTQPIELHLNLDRPFLLVRCEGRPGEGEVALLRERLEAGAKDFRSILSRGDGAEECALFLAEVL